MKKLFVWIMLIVMALTMFPMTGFAEESIPFEEIVPELKSISSDAFGVVTLKWGKVSGAENYRVYRKLPGAEKWSLITTTKDTECVVRDSELNKEYAYTVRAYRENETVRSAYNKAGLKHKATRKVVSFTSVKNVGMEAITLTWKAVSGGAKYEISRKEDGGKWKVVKTLSKAESWTDMSVVNGKKYAYRICVIKTLDGKEYRTADDKTGKAIVCDCKTTVKLGKVTAGLNAATVNWKELPGADYYYVYRKTKNSDWKYIGETKKLSYTDTALKKGTIYYYTVRGIKEKSNGKKIKGWRNLTGVNIKATTSVKPELKSIKNVGFGAVTLEWGKITGAQSYCVYRKTAGGEYKLLKSGIKGTSYTDTTVATDKTYVYSVRGYRKQSGTGYYSSRNETGLKIKPATVKEVPLKSIATGFNAAKITWDEVKGVETYRIYRRPVNGDWELVAKNIKTTTYTDKTLKKGVEYIYTVRGLKGNALTGYNKNGLKAKGVVPTTVKLKSVTMPCFRTVKVTWQPILGADGYGIYRKEGSGEWKWLKNTTGTEFIDDTPDMNRKYFYSVRAYRVNGDKKTWSGWDQKGLAITLKSNIDPKKPMVAITYDDGPGKYTGKILNVLEKYDAHATFFVVGRNAANNPSTLKRAFELGCEIGNHSYSHPYLTRLTSSELSAEISKTDKAVKKAIGVTPTLIRPPYGSHSEKVRSRVSKSFILWSVDTLDWEHRSASKNLACIKKNVRDGSIVLMHDIHKSTADSAESIVSYLTNKGYQLVTVSELAYYKGYDLKNGKSYSRFY